MGSRGCGGVVSVDITVMPGLGERVVGGMATSRQKVGLGILGETKVGLGIIGLTASAQAAATMLDDPEVVAAHLS